MNALSTVLNVLVLQTLTANCSSCKIGNYVRQSELVLSMWSLDRESPECDTDFKFGGVTVLTKSAAIPEIRLPKELTRKFSSSFGYICQPVERMKTGNDIPSQDNATGLAFSTPPTTSSNAFIQSTIFSSKNFFTSNAASSPTKDLSYSTPSPTSSVLTSSVPTKHSNPPISSTAASFSRAGTTEHSFVTSSPITVETTTTMQSSTNSIVTSAVPTTTYNPLIPSTASENDDLSTTPVFCPHRYEATVGKTICYQFIYEPLMFADASNYCKDIRQNAHLVSLENPYEEAWVVRLIENIGGAAGRDYWIGLKNGVYTWEDGSYLSYANFGDKYTEHGGECLYMDVSKDSIWKGGRCDTDKKEILCEYELTSSPSSCSLSYESSCYEIQDQNVRDQATQVCNGLYKYVVQVETADEQDFLNTVLTQDVWIGVVKNESATYVWEDKSNTAAEYLNFGSANSVTPLPHGGICHRMKHDESYSWNEARCDTEHSFICEWALE